MSTAKRIAKTVHSHQSQESEILDQNFCSCNVYSRPFLPERHRNKFDKVLSFDPLRAVSPSGGFSDALRSVPSGGSSLHNISTNGILDDYSASSSDVRRVTIHRESGTFGLVVRGHSPVYVENVTPGGPADRAGLLPGDAILTLNGLDVRHRGHQHVIRLLKGSGKSPNLQVQQLLNTQGVPVIYQESLTSESSNNSSHTSSGLLDEVDGGMAVEIRGNSFKGSADRLLTHGERTELRNILTTYNRDRNVPRMVDEMRLILDTPTKKTLWAYILPRMPPDHREYVLRIVDLPKQQILDILSDSSNQQNSQFDSLDSQTLSVSQQETSLSLEVPDEPRHIRSGSFRQQLNVLLTRRERSELKRALQIYAEKRNIQHLIEDLLVILDTPSKQKLWFYLIPLLSPHHQSYTQKRLGLPEHVIKSPPEGRYKKGPHGYYGYRSLSRSGHSNVPVATPRHGDVTFQPDDFRMVGEAASMLRSENSIDIYSEDEDFMTLPSVASSRVAEVRGRQQVAPPTYVPGYTSDVEQNTLVMNPVYASVKPKHVSTPNSKGIRHYRETSSQTIPKSLINEELALSASSLILEEEDPYTDYKTIVRLQERPTRKVDIIQVEEFHEDADDDTIDGDNQFDGGMLHSQNGRSSYKSHSPTIQIRGVPGLYASVHPMTSRSQNVMMGTRERLVNGRTNGAISEVEYESESSATRNRSLNSNDSFEAHAMNAIKALDEVVIANEPSDSDSFNSAPLPPPPPPAPPLPDESQKTMFESNSMNVKRMNWEKIASVEENTIWAQIEDSGDDLDDVVKYLELEQQFSTKNTKIAESYKDRKNEICILHPKKAYNISILLGHLKKPVAEVKESLYQMDESILTPELLKQMTTYVPDSSEMDRYDSFKGSTDELSKPDQFMYHMTRVPGFKDRLKALVFKANFAEKVEEIKQSLMCIKKASEELRQSNKLAKVIQLILAMGNYMNKGNSRVDQASGFKVNFLTQLDLTKTSDKKGTFLNVLAEAMYAKYPRKISLSHDLPTLQAASKVSNEAVTQEVADLRRVLQDIEKTTQSLGAGKSAGGPSKDRFYDVMHMFLSRASDEIQNLLLLHTNALNEYNAMLTYLGENPNSPDTGEIFTIFATFISKFEKAHQLNMAQKNAQESPNHFVDLH